VVVVPSPGGSWSQRREGLSEAPLVDEFTPEAIISADFECWYLPSYQQPINRCWRGLEIISHFAHRHNVCFLMRLLLLWWSERFR
jgi:hypothetical protein